MFSQVSVILFTWGCVHPSMHWARHPPPCMPGYTSPLPSACWDTPPAQCMLGCTSPRRPLERSCFFLQFQTRKRTISDSLGTVDGSESKTTSYQTRKESFENSKGKRGRRIKAERKGTVSRTIVSLCIHT